MSAQRHQQFNSRWSATELPGAMSRDPQSLCNQSCQNILYKSVFEHFDELPNIAALLLASKSLQNSSFGANFAFNFVIDERTIHLLKHLLAPSSCFSIQLVPSLHIKNFEGNAELSNFVAELASTKYLSLQLQSLTLERANESFALLFFSDSRLWPQLQSLVLLSGQINDNVAALISKSAPHLRTLRFSDSTITDVGLEHLSTLSSITSLNLYFCDEITDAGLEHVSQLSNINFLGLGGLEHIDDQGIIHISKLANITSLNLSCSTWITDASLEYVSQLFGIDSLDLAYCNKITDVGLQLISQLSSVTLLNLTGCNKISDDGLLHLVKLSNLKLLDLSGCSLITAEAQSKFESALPNCCVYCEVEEAEV